MKYNERAKNATNYIILRPTPQRLNLPPNIMLTATAATTTVEQVRKSKRLTSSIASEIENESKKSKIIPVDSRLKGKVEKENNVNSSVRKSSRFSSASTNQESVKVNSRNYTKNSAKSRSKSKSEDCVNSIDNIKEINCVNSIDNIKEINCVNYQDPFTIAKRAFHRSGDFKIVGRVQEKADLTCFWYENVVSERGGSIYISGNPGTGKTALVDELLPELIESSGFSIKLIKINCMMLKEPLKVLIEIAKAVNISITDKNPFMIMNSLEKYFTSGSGDYHVLIIDEIDQIGMKDPELLCKLLAMTYLPNVHVSLFGIANSMDLTERFLPRLKLLNCELTVINFPQYTNTIRPTGKN